MVLTTNITLKNKDVKKNLTLESWFWKATENRKTNFSFQGFSDVLFEFPAYIQSMLKKFNLKATFLSRGQYPQKSALNLSPLLPSTSNNTLTTMQ